MSRADDLESPWKAPGVSHYLTVCLAALGVIWLVLLQRTTGMMELQRDYGP